MVERLAVNQLVAGSSPAPSVSSIKQRIIDINGDTICSPAHYYEALDAIIKMNKEMWENNIDVSDMYVTLMRLFEEANFHLRFIDKEAK